MSEQEEIELFDRIRVSIQQAQRKLFERKAKLGESIVIDDGNGKPLIIKAEDYLKRTSKK